MSLIFLSDPTPLSSDTSNDERKECSLCFPFDSDGCNYFTESFIIVRNFIIRSLYAVLIVPFIPVLSSATLSDILADAGLQSVKSSLLYCMSDKRQTLYFTVSLRWGRQHEVNYSCPVYDTFFLMISKCENEIKQIIYG
jgi:hypothetical protein